MQTFRETQKRKPMLMVIKKKEKRRSNGTEALKFLREKMDNEKEYREQELEVRKKDIEKGREKRRKTRTKASRYGTTDAIATAANGPDANLHTIRA